MFNTIKSTAPAASVGAGTGALTGGAAGPSTTAPATAGGSTSSTAAGTAIGATLGGTNFLTLMLAQLKNQDPTSPVDSKTFLTQLAQLSEVQGITSLNTSFGSLANSLASNQALQASSLLGHRALVNSSTATLSAAGGEVTGAVNIPQTTASAVLSVADSSGTLVKSINLGAQAAGLTSFKWDGVESSGAKAPAGTYTLSVAYAGQTDKSAAAITAINGMVESVSLGAGATGMTLNVAGVGSVPFSSLQQISN